MNIPAKPLAKSISYITAALGGFLPTTVVFAQDNSELLIEEIVVTASRREELLNDVAMSVAAVDTDSYMSAGLTGLADILPTVPGVAVVDNGTPFGNTVYMRGVNAELSAGVTSYVDDIPMGGSSTIYTVPYPLDGALLDLRNMEVLKGPQGTLYGASSLSGLLKYRTQPASLDEWSGNVLADLSNTDEGGLNQLYRGSFNGPISDDVAVSATAFWKDKTGYIENPVAGVEHWDDYEHTGASGSVYWQATPELDITLQGLYVNSEQAGTALIQANAADDTPEPGLEQGEPLYGDFATGQAITSPSEYEASMAGVTLNYDMGFATLKSITSTQDMSYAESQDVTATEYGDYADIFFPENAPHTSTVLEKELGFDKVTQELRLTSESNQSFEWILGGFYTSEDGYNIQELVTTPVEILLDTNFPSEYEESSAYATGTYYFTPRLDATLGVRHASYSNTVLMESEGPLGTNLEKSKIEDKVTTYLFNTRYRIDDDTTLYGRVASGYRPGGANFVVRDPGTGNPISNPIFEPDSLWSYELGLKGALAGGDFRYDLATYYIDWQDYLIRVVRGGLAVASNAEKASSRGAEVTLSYEMTDAFTVSTTLSYTDAQLEVDEPELGGAAGTQLPNTPEVQAYVNADYSFSLGQLPAYMGLSWRFKDETPTGFEGYTDEEGIDWPSSQPRFVLDSYSLLDLRAGLSTDAMDLSFYVTNALNEYAYSNYFADSLSATPIRPRTYGTSVSFKF